MIQGELLDNITRLVILSSLGHASGELLMTPGDGVRKKLAYKTWTTIGRAFIFHMYILMDIKIFDQMTLTLMFDLL